MLDFPKYVMNIKLNLLELLQDLVLIDINKPWTVKKENILYKCNWSPFEGLQFDSQVTHTIVNGKLVYENGLFNSILSGKKLTFNSIAHYPCIMKSIIFKRFSNR
jgi:hypothetical protein